MQTRLTAEYTHFRNKENVGLLVENSLVFGIWSAVSSPLGGKTLFSLEVIYGALI